MTLNSRAVFHFVASPTKSLCDEQKTDEQLFVFCIMETLHGIHICYIYTVKSG